jgi:excisionase family DNA binding protein
MQVRRIGERELSGMLGVSRSDLYQLAQEQRLPYVSIGGEICVTKDMLWSWKAAVQGPDGDIPEPALP